MLTKADSRENPRKANEGKHMQRRSVAEQLTTYRLPHYGVGRRGQAMGSRYQVYYIIQERLSARRCTVPRGLHTAH